MSPEQLNVVFLGAGFGTRLKDLINTAKALVPKGKDRETLLEKLLNQLSKIPEPLAITLISNGVFFDQFKDAIDQLKRLWQQADAPIDLNIDVINNQAMTSNQRLGAIGDSIEVIDRMDWWEANKDVLILSSDTEIPDRTLMEFAKFAQAHPDGFCTIVRDMGDKTEIAGKLGCAVPDPSNPERMIDFVEKPTDPPSTLASIPMYYWPKNLLGKLKEYQTYINEKYHNDPENRQKYLDAPGRIIPWLIEQGVPVYMHVITGPTLDISSPESLNKYLAK